MKPHPTVEVSRMIFGVTVTQYIPSEIRPLEYQLCYSVRPPKSSVKTTFATAVGARQMHCRRKTTELSADPSPWTRRTTQLAVGPRRAPYI
jgi:hypothetical protein